MKKLITILAVAVLMLCMTATAFAAPYMECFPTAVTRSEDGSEIRKMYDLSPGDDPMGIPRSDFEEGGFHYTLRDLLKQELPENESRYQVETVTVESESKDMATILTLLPQEREFVTDDGLCGVLTLKLESVNVEVSGYGSSTRTVTASRTYPGLSSQDTQLIPKTVEENGRTLTLQNIDWQASGSGVDGSELYTAFATYSGSATSSYVKGYTVTAEYAGTVSRIVLNRTRYVAIFEGVCLNPTPAPTPEPTIAPVADDEPAASASSFNWSVVLIPIGIVLLAGIAVGAGIFIKRRKENEEA